MKRNWYAIAILVLLAAVLLGCKQYVSATAGSLRAQVQSAYAQTLTQQYPQAQQAFRQAAHSARQASKKTGAAGAPQRAGSHERNHGGFAAVCQPGKPGRPCGGSCTGVGADRPAGAVLYGHILALHTAVFGAGIQHVFQLIHKGVDIAELAVGRKQSAHRQRRPSFSAAPWQGPQYRRRSLPCRKSSAAPVQCG